MEVQSRSFGDALNHWFRSLGRIWSALLFSSIAVHLPLALLLAVLFIATGVAEQMALLSNPEYLETLTDTQFDEQFLDLMIQALWVVILWVILQTLATLFVYLAASRAIAEDLTGAQPRWSGVSRFALRRLPTAVGATLILSLGFLLILAVAVGIGWLMIGSAGVDFLTVFLTAVVGLTAIVVFVWLGIGVSVTTQTIAMENIGPWEAIVRSFRLVRDRWWITLGFLLVTSLIVSAVSQALSFALVPLFFVSINVPEAITLPYALIILLQGLLAPAIAAAYAIWYVDLRARKERLLAEQLLIAE